MKLLKSFLSINTIYLLVLCCYNNGSAQVIADTLIASQYFKKGDSLLTQRALDSSLSYFQKALPIYEASKVWENVAKCYNQISEYHWRNQEYEQSLKNAKKAIKISTKYLEKEAIQKAYAYDNIGIYYELAIFDYETALMYYKKALDLKKRILPKDNIGFSFTFNNIGGIFFKKGEYDKALEYHQKSLLLKIKKNVQLAYSYNEIGRVYIAKKAYQKALQYFKKSLSIDIKTLGKINLEVATDFNNIGVAYRGNKEYDKALEYYNKALDIYIKLYGDNHVRVSNSYYNIGLIHHA
ncbi:tetratricopeptide repeat protein [Aquimarina sp. RZ0]|uniref:tetratricopeptide repeat protein n=1 Tax=Aquimarina sp. RZ0 TaxID=2607730 RepID=UPI00165F3C9E|nr:tetratricopeptide repeat protein [Aquimarina sp. RZ0]